MLVVLTHGGAGSARADHDGPDAAAQRGLERLRAGDLPLEAAVEACRVLEDDERFNAGTGSNLRFDGKTIEMDASCMAETGAFGAVACIQDIRHPIDVARAVLDTPHNLLAGIGATAYARKIGAPVYNPWTQRAQDKLDRLRAKVRALKFEPDECAWDIAKLREAWNFETPFHEVLGPQDTVGAVASDGRGHFAATLSTGGTMSTLLGRVGDVPLIGCGLMAGPSGALCVTGDGDSLARDRIAGRAYAWLEDGLDAAAVRDRTIARFPHHVDVGIIVIDAQGGHAGGSNRDMAWSARSAEAQT